MAGERIRRRLTAILAADVAGYSRLMGADEARTVSDLKAHQAVLFPMVSEFGGRIIDTAGDGILAEFASAVQAVECAAAIQRVMAERNAAIDQTRRMQLRIGVNIGDVIYDEARIYGDGINVAARLEAIAEPGGICLSEDAYRQTRGKVSAEFADVGEQTLKNIARPVRAYKLLLDGSSTAAALELQLPNKPSIAVLPFANLSGGPEDDYFVDGLVDDIITALSHFRSLFVIARNSSFTYKGQAVDVKQVGRELGVRYVLEGTVRRAANRVRIAAQLIDATTATHISAERFDTELKDIFDLQEKVAASVAGAIAPRLQRTEIERARRKPTGSLDAYDYFMRASASFYQWTRDGNEEALRFLEKAIELDPDFAAAYSVASQCFCFRKSYGPWEIDTETTIAETTRFARRALELGKDDAFVLCCAGYALAYVAGELDAGASFVDRALALNPNLALAWMHSGWIRIWLGEPEIAIEHLARAMRLSPLDPIFHVMQAATASAHFFAGEYDEASSWAQKALREQPNNLDVIGLLAMSDALAGRLEKARAGMARLVQLSPGRSLSNIEDRLPPYRRPEDRAKVLKAARRAGLAE